MNTIKTNDPWVFACILVKSEEIHLKRIFSKSANINKWSWKIYF